MLHRFSALYLVALLTVTTTFAQTPVFIQPARPVFQSDPCVGKESCQVMGMQPLVLPAPSGTVNHLMLAPVAQKMVNAGLFLNLHPLVACEGIEAGNECCQTEGTYPQGTECPHRSCGVRGSDSGTKRVAQSVLDNLKALEKASMLMREAEKRVVHGQIECAQQCLKQVCDLVPGSSYAHQSKALLKELVRMESVEMPGNFAVAIEAPEMSPCAGSGGDILVKRVHPNAAREARNVFFVQGHPHGKGLPHPIIAAPIMIASNESTGCPATCQGESQPIQVRVISHPTVAQQVQPAPTQPIHIVIHVHTNPGAPATQTKVIHVQESACGKECSGACNKKGECCQKNIAVKAGSCCEGKCPCANARAVKAEKACCEAGCCQKNIAVKAGSCCEGKCPCNNARAVKAEKACCEAGCCPAKKIAKNQSECDCSCECKTKGCVQDCECCCSKSRKVGKVSGGCGQCEGQCGKKCCLTNCGEKPEKACKHSCKGEEESADPECGEEETPECCPGKTKGKCPASECGSKDECCPGVELQVSGLMKACYQAIEEGRVEKAADLARQAHGLDPARVEGDPVVYKCHLLRTCARGFGDSEIPVVCRECPASNHPEKLATNAGEVEPIQEKKPGHVLTIGLGFSVDSGLTGHICIKENETEVEDVEPSEEMDSVQLDRMGAAEWCRYVFQSMVNPSAKPIEEKKVDLTMGLSLSGRIHGSAKVPFQGRIYHLGFRDGLPILMMSSDNP